LFAIAGHLHHSDLFIKMSPLQDSPELPPTRASVRGRGTGRKQKKIPDKTVDASLIEPADSGQALNHEHIQTRNKKKEYGDKMGLQLP
jgi:hypothetical protein